MKLVPFDNDRHRGFVLPTFSMQAGLPGATIDRLIRDGANVIVGESPKSLQPGQICQHCGEYNTLRCPVTNEEHVLLYGWGGTFNKALVWCFVKMKLTAFKLDPKIMLALGVDVNQPIPVMFTGPALRAMAGRYGWRLQWRREAGADAVRLAQ
jgi:hypothetical protein